MTKKKLLSLFLILLFCIELFGIDRRKDQYNFTPGYFVIPAPYSIPGIGEGVALIGMATNIYDTQTDVLGDIILGDVEGYGIGLMDYYLVDKHLKLELENNGMVKDPWGNTRVGLALSGKINRMDYGVKYNSVLEAGGVAVGEDVKLDIELEGILAK